MFQLFNILENSWVNLSKEVGEKSQELAQQTEAAATSAVNKMSRSQSKIATSRRGSHSSSKRTSRARPKPAEVNAAKKEESPKTATGYSHDTNNTAQKSEWK